MMFQIFQLWVRPVEPLILNTPSCVICRGRLFYTRYTVDYMYNVKSLGIRQRLFRFFPEWCTRYHDVRNCKECLGIHLNTQTVLTFSDRGILRLLPGTRPVMPRPVITRSATGKAYYLPGNGTRVPNYPAGTRVPGARVLGSKCPAGNRVPGSEYPAGNRSNE